MGTRQARSARGACVAAFAIAIAACATGAGDTGEVNPVDSGTPPDGSEDALGHHDGDDATRDSASDRSTGGDGPSADGNDGAADASDDSAGDADDASDASDASDGADADAAGDSSLADAKADAKIDSGPDASDSGSVLYIFVTSQLYTGNLGGLAGADGKCQTLATAAGLPGTYKAWLSAGATAAKSRLTHAAVPYVLVDHTLIANDWSDLVGPGPHVAVDKTETGGAAPVGTVGTSGGCNPTNHPYVWTDTDWTGASLGTDDCTTWGATTGSWTYTGDATSAFDWSWSCTAVGNGVCGATAALYCLQQ